MLGKDIRNLISALNLTVGTFAKHTAIPLLKLKRMVGKDKHKEVTDATVLSKLYIGGLELVNVRGNKLKEQADNLATFQPMFEEIEQWVQDRAKARAKDKKFKERFDGGGDVEEEQDR